MDAYNNVGIDSIETAKNLKKLRILIPTIL